MYISIDLGGTNTRIVGCTNLESPEFIGGTLRHKNTGDYEIDLQFMINSALQISNGASINAVGIGTPGTPNEARTQIDSVKHLVNWIGKPFVERLSESLSCPVYYDNDAVAASLGEAYYTDLNTDFHYIVWGTGIGGADVRFTGQNEVEATKLIWKTHFMEWESDCGGAELAKTFGKAPEDFTDKDWEIVYKNFETQLLNYINVNHPHVIVFGGGLAIKCSQMITDLNKASNTPLYVTKFAENSGLMGGFGLIKQRYLK
jgi:predicted NBD/HSP70 family sugar kinase